MIIDAPVLSIDSQSLFYVAVLTRKMIRVCYSNYELYENDEGTNGIVCNKSPVKSYYEALWADFHSTNNKNYLMSIARQIIYYHFIRIGDYNPFEIRIALNNTKQHNENGQKANIYTALLMP